MTTNVNLSPQLTTLVKKKVASGHYASVSEVVREGLRLLAERDRVQSLKLKRLRQDIRDGMNSGPSTPWNTEELKRAGRALHAKRLAESD